MFWWFKNLYYLCCSINQKGNKMNTEIFKNKEKVTRIDYVNHTEMVNFLKTVETGTFINMVMLTDVRMRKTNNPLFGKVKKLTSGNYLVGNDYENRVRSNQVKEGDEPTFESEKPKGKTHVTKCVLVDDKTGQTHYLMVERFDELKTQSEYVTKDFDMLDDVQMELVKQFKYQNYQSKKQTQDRKVMVITPKIENILSVTIGKTKYIQTFD